MAKANRKRNTSRGRLAAGVHKAPKRRQKDAKLRDLSGAFTKLLRAGEQRENDHEWEEKRNKIAVKITKTPATDLDGLKAKTLVAVQERPELWRKTVRDLDWHLQVVRSLIEAACVVTGLQVPEEQVEEGYQMPEEDVRLANVEKSAPRFDSAEEVVDRLAAELQFAHGLKLAIRGDAEIAHSDVAPLIALADVHCQRLNSIHVALSMAVL